MSVEATICALSDRVEQLRAAQAGRTLVGLVGEPGSGKSTLTVALAQQLSARGIATAVVAMDGFHLAKDELARLGRTERKGALDTFDGGGYVALLRRLRAEVTDVVYAPRYSRGAIGESIGSAIPVGPEVGVVLTEGNYLLVPEHPWDQVRTLLAQAWYVDVDPELRRERLLARHVRTGKTAAAAAAFTHGSDEVNAALVRSTRERADLHVAWT